MSAHHSVTEKGNGRIKQKENRLKGEEKQSIAT